jgi:hypothetical protein
MVTRNLQTVEQVIEALGGFKAVGELTKRNSANAAWNWKERNAFPTNTYVIMKGALKEIGAKAPDSLWNMVEPEGVAS